MKSDTAREPQYDRLHAAREQFGLPTLGLMTGHGWADDPRRLGFTLARYKFAAKMLSGCNSVLEIGCGDAFGTRVVAQEVGNVTAIDFDPLFVADVNARAHPKWLIDCFVHDMRLAPVKKDFDGIFALDVLEHIKHGTDESFFLTHATQSLKSHGGIAVFGMPSLESQIYASPISKEGHVNCKSAPDLKAKLLQFFRVVLMFSMNDEIVHTGYHKMAQYILAVCSDRRDTSDGVA